MESALHRRRGASTNRRSQGQGGPHEAQAAERWCPLTARQVAAIKADAAEYLPKGKVLSGAQLVPTQKSGAGPAGAHTTALQSRRVLGGAPRRRRELGDGSEDLSTVTAIRQRRICVPTSNPPRRTPSPLPAKMQQAKSRGTSGPAPPAGGETRSVLPDRFPGAPRNGH